MKIISTPDAPPSTSPVSQAVACNGFVFIGGQMPRDSLDGSIPVEPARQMALTLQHCRALLHAAGSGPERVALVTVFLTDLSIKPLVNEAFSKFFGAHRPARNLVEVSAIGEGAIVEVAMIAAL